LIFIVLFIIVAGEFRAESTVELWLRGNPEMTLAEIRFTGQGREVTNKDPSVISYLNMVARNAQRVAGPIGEVSYYGQLRIGRDVARQVVIDVSKDRKQIDIGVPKGWGTEYTYWAIDIGNDAPKELMDLLIFLTDEQFRGRTIKR